MRTAGGCWRAWPALTRPCPSASSASLGDGCAKTAPLNIAELDDSATLWDPLADLTGAYLVKVVLSPKQLPAFDRWILTAEQRRYGVGGNVAWVATEDISQASDALAEPTGLTGLCLRGAVESAVIGAPLENVLAARVKQVLNPHGKLGVRDRRATISQILIACSSQAKSSAL